MSTDQLVSRRRSKPVVIYRLGSLGDTVVALPCFHRIEQSFPDSERIALTNFPVNSKASALGAILGDSGIINRSVAYPVALRSISGLVELRRQLRAIGSDTLVYLTPARGLVSAWRDVIFFKLCGFRHIIGAPLIKDLQNHRVEPSGELEPEFSRMARCLRPLGAIDFEAASSWDLRFSDIELEAAASLTEPFVSKPYIAINMGGKVAKNDWGIDNWLALIASLNAALAGHGLLILGSSEDDPRAVRIQEAWSGPTVNACGRATPRVSGASAKGARLFVGHDSGPLHLAACVGVPCVGLFGDHYRPRIWHPCGMGHRIIHNMSGVLSISVDEVMSACSSLLGNSARPTV